MESVAPQFFDGAFGTYYFSLTGDFGPCEMANLSNPGIVKEIHRAYLQAGSRLVKTNTFSASPATIPVEAKLRDVIAAGWELACEAAGEYGARVFADIGVNDGANAAEDYCAVAGFFLELGATDFLFETLSSFEEILPALQMIRQRVPKAQIYVSFAAAQDGYTKRGLYYRELLRQAMACDAVDAAGLNCVCGPSHMVGLLQDAGPMPKPLLAMPNSGYPSKLNGRVVFEDNAEYFAYRLAELYKAGADILGGCCGTTPKHIEAGIQAVRSAKRPKRTAAEGMPAKMPAEQGRMAGKHKQIAVELDPPLDADCDFLIGAAKTLRQAGVDLITVADSPLSRARADSIMTAAKIKRETGVEVMPHICCRDKNHIALKGGLLGAAFEGIHQVLVVTGDPPMQSDLRRNAGVFSFNSYDLISFIVGMNAQVFAQKPFLVGGALNVNAVNFESELKRAKLKLEKGASMLFTQPIFSDLAVENFLYARKALSCRLFAGILPVAGYKNALFLLNEVSGIEIPAEVLEALKDQPPEKAAEISVAYSTGIIKRVYHAADGFYIMTPLRKTNIVVGLMEQIRRMENDSDR